MKEIVAKADKAYNEGKTRYKRYVFGKPKSDVNGAVYIDRSMQPLESITIIIKEKDDEAG